MAPKREEITATFSSERFRFSNADGDTIIGTARTPDGEVAVKGQADMDELQPGQTYRFYGRWQPYKNKRTGQTEQQFAFESFVRETPHGREGVVAYLKSAGEGLGLGAARCQKLWELFGPDAVRMLRESPAEVAERLAAVGLKLQPGAAEEVAANLRHEMALEACTLELMELLSGRGFRKTLPKMLLREHGNKAAEMLADNPFMLLDFPWCGFERCDKLWRHFGKPLDDMRRQMYCAWYAVSNDKTGSVWVARSAVESSVRALIGRDAKPAEAIQMAIDAGMIVQERTNGAKGPITETGSCYWLATKKNADNEARLAQLVADAMREPHDWPEVESIENIDGEQPDALRKCLTGAIAILEGRPGTGKTFCSANLIRALTVKFGEGKIGIGAPTNLAAARLNQAMESYQVKIRATTNHRLLGRPRVRGQEWNHNRSNPLPFRVLIFDESSMKDLAMAVAIFEARSKGTMILLVGDTNQLPPIAAGAPLRDLKAAGLPCATLKQIRRNSGGIVEACKNIAEGRPWGAGDNLEIVQVDDEPGQQAAVLEKLRECSAAGLSPVWDSRVIVAKNLTRQGFNKLLQGELNHNPPITGSPFRVEDKVICRDNVDLKLIDLDSDEDVEYGETASTVRVANGELGKVLEVHADHLIVEVFCPRRVVQVSRFPPPKDGDAKDSDDGEKEKTNTGCVFDLAYAVTYHSSQGSEFPWPILVASSRDGFMGSRELVYTGISRGKVKCKLIGLKATWDKFCRRVSLDERKTLLKERIHLATAKDILADL